MSEKDKRQEAPTRLYREVYSMGARVENTRCSLCGHQENHEHDVVAVDLKPRFMSVGLVPAPMCETCGEMMTYLDGTDWSCPSTDCSQHDVCVTTGIGGIIRRE